MTACAVEAPAGNGGTAGHTGFVIAADGSYGARLTLPAGGRGGGRCPERWTLDGPEPYTVRLPGDGPEEPGTQLLPLADGRVLVARRETGAHRLSLLYPSGPATGELPLGQVDSAWLTLLPPTPDGLLAYALVAGADRSEVWLVAGGPAGPQRVAEVRGRCAGGVWLDRDARLLALDRTEPGGGGFAGGCPGGAGGRAAERSAGRSAGRTKTVVVDLCRGGEVSPLLQIAEHSDDRLLLADPDSGLLVLRSDAPGEERLGWGVLGSSLPVRFPEALGPDGVRLTPFAVQPGPVLLPESCAVALRADGPNGTWVALWRPSQRRLRHVPAPHGWLRGSGVWTAGGELRLPYVTEQTGCGLARVGFAAEAAQRAEAAPAAWPTAGQPGGCGAPSAAPMVPAPVPEPAAAPFTPPPLQARPVPLQQAPMAHGNG